MPSLASADAAEMPYGIFQEKEMDFFPHATLGLKIAVWKWKTMTLLSSGFLGL